MKLLVFSFRPLFKRHNNQKILSVLCFLWPLSSWYFFNRKDKRLLKVLIKNTTYAQPS